MPRKIAVVGLGYVGLPVAIALAEKFERVVGFDIDPKRIAELREGSDRSREVGREALNSTRLILTADISDLSQCDFFIVAVPTPIDANRQPDLRALTGASRLVGSVLKKGDIVVFESTVFPGATEEVCVPIMEENSGLKHVADFNVGYSPERINPGDKKHTLKSVIKIVSGDTPESLDVISSVYGAVVEAGIFKAGSIQIAEAAKVIENTQRDLNIALMNELAIIFEKMGISTKEVLEAANTKWNFLNFTPGLVGGHCIGVDPYYLTAKAERLGYHPEVILSGRRINDSMGVFIAQKLVKMLIAAHKPLDGARVGVLGVTFKENVPDIRNSRVPDIIKELKEFGITAVVTDPLASPEETHEEYGINLVDIDQMRDLDGLILAVPHEQYKQTLGDCTSLVKRGGVIVDVKAALDHEKLQGIGFLSWSL